MSTKTYTVAIVDDHPVLLDGIKRLISQSEILSVVHAYADPVTFLAAFEKQPTDIAILDIHMKGKDGLACAQFIKAINPAVKIIFYSMFLEKSLVGKAIKAGASAYIDKSATEQEVLSKILNVINGQNSISDHELPAETALLSMREKEIVFCLMEGMKPEEISKQLFISQLTVRTHIRNIHTKLQVSSTQEIAMRLKEQPSLFGL